MLKYIHIFKDLISTTISTIIGVIVGVGISEWIKIRGKVNFIINSFDIKFLYQTSYGMGGFECKEDINITNIIKYEYEILIYNSKEINKFYTDINTIFECESNQIIKHKPYNKLKYEIIAGRTEYEDVKAINIKPKEYITLNLKGEITDIKEIEKIKQYKNAYIRLKDEKGKQIKRKINIRTK